MDRTKYIGGSDVAGILGISPWRTPLEVYLDKVQPRVIEDPRKQKIFSRGSRMEPYVIDLLAEEEGLEIVARGNRYIDSEYGFIAAEIDAETACGMNVEIKTVSPFKAKEWGEVQTDAVPVWYTAQTMHGLMVTKKDVCIFGVLIGGDDFRVYRVERDDETIAAIREKEVEFWARVQNLEPPEFTNVNDVLRMFEKDSGKEIEADSKALEAYIRLKELKARFSELEDEILDAESKIKMYMQDSAILTANGSRLATWKTQNTRRFNLESFKEKNESLYNEFVKTTQTRVFRLK